MPQQVYHSPVYHSQSIQAWEQRWFARQNSSYGLTICAERNAIAAAVAAGVRTFQVLYVVADSQRPVAPCGARGSYI